MTQSGRQSVEERGAPRRVAFFGGSFDPPHLGHLAVAGAALAALRLDQVLFAPVGAQPLKPWGSSTDFAQRVEMTRLAIADEAAFALSLADAPKPGGEPNYTFETLGRLRSELPAGCELFCLMGADSFAGVRRWHRGAEIPFLAPLIVASRPGERLDDLRALLPEGLFLEPEVGLAPTSAGILLERYRLHNAKGDSAPFYLLPGLEIEISASQIREQLRQAESSLLPSSLALLPDAVAGYIRAQKLYQ
jgi:nicotinate-nucleotide adenylyltransferase